MQFRIGIADLTTISDKDTLVIGCSWNGYNASCAKCPVKCPVRNEIHKKKVVN